MKHTLKEILFALFLGLLFPILLFSVMSWLIPNVCHTQPVRQTVETEKLLKDETVYVRVEIEDTVVNMPLEEYILSVVLREMPSNFHPEALKAQAVVARTYTLRQIKKGGKHKNADVCTESSCCQGYWDLDSYLASGGTQDKLAKVKAAVDLTTGQILLYDGVPIDATYFSCSGGNTEDAVAVWGTDVPYLKATVSPGEESAKYYTDTVRFSLQEFSQKIGLNLKSPQTLRVGEIEYTAGGGVSSIELSGKTFQGTTVRKRLGLRSTAFVISVANDHVIVTTKGYGHRVGMSQYGADAMAESGKNYSEILHHYYSGVELTAMSVLY